MAGFGRTAPIAGAFGFGRGGSSLSARGPRLGAPPKPPQTILGMAAAGHPNWFPGSHPGSQHPSGGVGSAGSSLLNLAGNLTQPQNTAGQAAPTQPTGAGSSPYDATYYNDVNNFLGKTNDTIAADQAKIGNYDTTLQSTLGQLAYQQPRDALALQQRANTGGSLFSSVYGQNQGNLAHAYTAKQTAAQTAHDQAVNALTTEISQLQGSEDPNSPTMIGFGLASAQRAAAAAQNNPSLGANPPAAPGASSSGSRGGGGGRGRGRATGAGSALLNLAGRLTQGRKH